MTADATLPASDDLTPEVLARWEELAIPELLDAEVGWDLADPDWTEDLFHRARQMLVALLSGVRSGDARIAELEAEVAARDAVIEAVKDFAGDADQYDEGTNEWPAPVILFDALAAAPSSVLAARDAEKWGEGFNACASGGSLRNPYRSGATNG